MSDKKHWAAERTAHPSAADHKWAIVYNPTPGGRDNGDGTRSYGMRFPALLISDLVDEPEKAALEIADMLNRAEAQSV